MLVGPFVAINNDGPGDVALHWAAKGGRTDVAKYLIENGANKADVVISAICAFCSVTLNEQ